MPKYNDNLANAERTSLPAFTEQDPPWKGQVLVGDDEPRLRASLCEILRHDGFNVDAAADGAAVCQHVQSGHYDLIVMNICMPGMTGLDVMAWLKATGSNIPILIISGLYDFTTLRRAVQMGAYDYLRKPYNVEELIRIVNEAVRAQRNASLQTTAHTAERIAEEFFRRALDYVPDVVFSLDEGGCINFLNNRVETLLGFRRKELMGQHLSCLVDDVNSAKLPHLLERRPSQKPFTCELELKTRINGIANLTCELTIMNTEDEHFLAARILGAAVDTRFLFWCCQRYHRAQENTGINRVPCVA